MCVLCLDVSHQTLLLKEALKVWPLRKFNQKSAVFYSGQVPNVALLLYSGLAEVKANLEPQVFRTENSLKAGARKGHAALNRAVPEQDAEGATDGYAARRGSGQDGQKSHFIKPKKVIGLRELYFQERSPFTVMIHAKSKVAFFDRCELLDKMKSNSNLKNEIKKLIQRECL